MLYYCFTFSVFFPIFTAMTQKKQNTPMPIAFFLQRDESFIALPQKFYHNAMKGLPQSHKSFTAV